MIHEEFDEELLPDKEAFYTWKTLQMLIIGMQKGYSRHLIIKIQVIIKMTYHIMIPLSQKADTLLLVDVFKIFRNKYIEIYELDPRHFHSGPGLAWQACLKKTGIELELFNRNQYVIDG